MQTIYVADNQLVKTGDLLITLESDDYAAGLAEARGAGTGESGWISGAGQNRFTARSHRLR